MANTYTLIASNTLSSSAASVTFSSIPSTYTDLVLRMSTRTDRANNVNAISLYINETETPGSTNYSQTWFDGNGSTTSSSLNSNSYAIFRIYSTTANNTASTFANQEIYIPSYTASQNKPISAISMQESNSASTGVLITATAGLWRQTSAITSLYLYPQGFNFVSGSSFFLYGIKNS